MKQKSWKKICSLVLCVTMVLSLSAVTAQAASSVKIGKYANDAVNGGEHSWYIILNTDNTFDLVTGDFEGIYNDTGTWTDDGSGNITANIDGIGSVIITGGGSDVLTLWNTPLYYDASSAPAPAPVAKQPTGQTVSPTDSTVYVNGTAKAFEAYNIGGSNYFKLRDIAFVLNGTNKQFDVGYDNATKAITLASTTPYTVAGGEMAQGDGKSKTATATASRIYLDGKELNFTVYNIAGNNFFKLVDLMNALDIGVTYNETTKNIGIDTNANHTGVVTVSESAPVPTPAPVSHELSAINLIDTLEPYAYTNLGNYVDYVLWYPTTGDTALTLAGGEYRNALALVEYADPAYASFNLDGKYSLLTGKVGMSDIGGRYEDDPSVIVNIYGDGNLLETMEIQIGDLPVDLSVDVSGVRALKFELAPYALYRATTIGFVDLELQ